MPERYQRVLLKLSGEAFAPDGLAGSPIDLEKVDRFGAEIAAAQNQSKTQIAVVVGGGNIWRGASSVAAEMDRVEADLMGMLATVINGLALKDALIRHLSPDPRVMSALALHKGCEDWIVNRARKHLEKDRIIICVAGLGEPNFTTDTAAVQRAREIRADIVLKATNVDGVYSADPRHHSDALLREDLSFKDAIREGYQVMDGTAFTHAQDAALPIRIFNATVAENITQALLGQPIGTLVHP